MKNIKNMTGEEIWALAGDMDVNEAIKSYGGPYNAARAAREFVFEGEEFEDLSEIEKIERRIESYLLKSVGAE